MRQYNPFARVRSRLVQLMIPLVLLGASALGAAATDPPGRVARVDLLEGSGSMQVAGAEGWTDDLLNRPLSGGDRVWIDERSRAEMHVGSSVLRLGSRTAVQILTVDDRTVRLSMTAGSLSVRIRELDSGDYFSIQTPAGEVSLQEPGSYRLDVDDSSGRAYLAVWSGNAEVSGPSGVRPVRQEQFAELVAGAEPAIDTMAARDVDSLDLWAQDRDNREDQSSAAQYVSRDVVGYQDLDGYGQWVSEPVYGVIWVPAVAVGWAPYHNGYWNWIAPWGWTWIAGEPWGFAPCHYGRWVHAPRYGWAWVPGPRSGPRPVYAPALVAWRGESNTKVNADVMHRPKVGWVPLGYNEVYNPPFQASPSYVRATNLANTHLAHAELDRYIDEQQHAGARGPERRYANDTVAGAYADAPREAFASAKSIGPPRALAAPIDAVRARFAAHEVLHAPPADRPGSHPVAHPVDYAPAPTTDWPRALAPVRTHSESSAPPDRPPRQAQEVESRTAQTSHFAQPQSMRAIQPIVIAAEPRPSTAAPVRTVGAPPTTVVASRDSQPEAGRRMPAEAIEPEPRQYSAVPSHSATAPSPAAVTAAPDAPPQTGRLVR
jgi:hypothetical protein